MKNFLIRQFPLFLMASLTLGLAPFNPPHIWGKLQWIAGGGAFSGCHPMQFMDWMDVALHGTPWILFIISGSLKLAATIKKNPAGNQL